MGASRLSSDLWGQLSARLGDRTETTPLSTVDAELEIANGSVKADLDLTPAREARVGDMTVRRLLPLRQRRSVGGASVVA